MNASGDRRCVFSPDRVYRYTLWREWMYGDDYVMFVCLNPSTADEIKPDPTVTRCIGFAQRWGYKALCMTNLFAFRSTKPRVMKAHLDPVGPDNDYWLKKMAVDAGIVIAAWGVHGAHRNRANKVIDLISPLNCLRVTKEGFPEHPLYLRADLEPIPYNRICYKK